MASSPPLLPQEGSQQPQLTKSLCSYQSIKSLRDDAHWLSCGHMLILEPISVWGWTGLISQAVWLALPSKWGGLGHQDRWRSLRAEGDNPSGVSDLALPRLASWWSSPNLISSLGLGAFTFNKGVLGRLNRWALCSTGLYSSDPHQVLLSHGGIWTETWLSVHQREECSRQRARYVQRPWGGDPCDKSTGVSTGVGGRQGSEEGRAR